MRRRGYRSDIRAAAPTVALLAAALAGAGWAATIEGSRKGELLRGTPRADVVRAGRGNDRVAVQMDGDRDRVACGPGRDVVTADRNDRVAADCETVSRAISRDGTRSADAQHETQAEPDALAVGSTIVATFQTGRRREGGAAGIGWATSRDGGRSWRNGVLGGQTVHSAPAGTATLASDPVVAYDAARGLWLISTLAVTEGLSELYVSRSRTGRSWSAPIVASAATSNELAYDKNWLTCDDVTTSPFFGRCYLAWTDHQGDRPAIAVSTSSDGGATWTRPVVAVRGREAVGVVPVVRPDGSVVLPFLGDGAMLAVRTTDGGATFSPPATISPVRAVDLRPVRDFPLPATDVGPDGRVWVAWADCRFRPACGGNDVVVSSSADGVRWTEPVRATRGHNTFVPAIGVDPASGRIAVAYHSLSTDRKVDVFLTGSGPAGSSWRAPRRLSAESMRPSWIANTTSGRMLADYIDVSWVGGRTVTVYALASPPRGGEFRQATFATAPLR